MPVSKGTITSNDGSVISYQTEGTGIPMLLCSGQGTSLQWWDRLAPELSRDFMVVRFDYLGTGSSIASPEAVFSTRRFAADAASILDALGLATAHVFGTSMGGKVAQWIALDYPERVDRLVLGCTTTGGPRAPRMAPHVAKQFMLPGVPGIHSRLKLMYTEDFLAGSTPNLSLATGPSDRQAIRGHRLASVEHDTSKMASAIKQPTLILHGTADEVVPAENCEILAQAIPNSTAHVFHGLRHGFFDEEAMATAEQLRQFLG